jgi:hypothetical protein
MIEAEWCDCTVCEWLSITIAQNKTAVGFTKKMTQGEKNEGKFRINHVARIFSWYICIASARPMSILQAY